MPNETRRIRILEKDHGELSIKGHYCKQKTIIYYNK